MAIACGLVLGVGASLRAWWEWLRSAPAETKDTCRWGLRGTHIRAGPFAFFMRVPARAPSEAASVLPPVVLVHGLVVSSRMVEPLAGALARYGLHVLAPDLPGFGESAKPLRPLDVTELADALALGLRAAGIPRAIFVGASFGCHVIVELALRDPAMVDRLVLLGPGPEPAARALPLALWRQVLNSQREPRSLGRISRVDYAKAGLRRAAATIRLALRERIEDKLPLVSMPSLVLRGNRDVIAPQAWAERVASLLPQGQLAVVEGAHVLSYDAPEPTAAAILAFLRETAAPLAEAAAVRSGR